jgi:hypothetical protein
VQFLAAYIMKGRLQAMTVAAALALLSLAFPPVSIVSSASVALVTLRRGGKEGLYVLLCGCLAAAVLSVFLKIGYQFALLWHSRCVGFLYISTATGAALGWGVSYHDAADAGSKT